MLIRIFCFAYIFFAPFTTWLSLSGWLRLPVVLLLSTLIISSPFLIKNFFRKPLEVLYDKEDNILLLFLATVWLSFFFGFGNVRSFNHTLSYTFSIFAYFIIFKYLLFKKEFTVSILSEVIAYSVILNNIIIIIEWTLINFYDFPIRNYFITGGENTSNMFYYWHNFYTSVGGTGEEPGGTASLLNMYFPIGLWFFSRKNSPFTIPYILIHVAGLFFLTSAAGLIILPLSYILVNISKWKFLIKYSYIPFLIIATISLLYITDFLNFQVLGDEFYSYIEQKVTFSESNFSGSDRKIKSEFALTDWAKSPILGNGPGYGVEEHSSGYFNMFLSLLADTGALSFLLFVSFLITIFIKLNKLPVYEKFFFMMSFICLILHACVYYVYYHGPFWITIIVIQLIYREHTKKKTLSNSLAN